MLSLQSARGGKVLRLALLIGLGFAISACASGPAPTTRWTSPDGAISLSIPESWEHVAPNQESSTAGALLLTTGTTSGAVCDVTRTEAGTARNYTAAFVRWAKQRQEETAGAHSYDFQPMNRKVNGVPVLDYAYTSTDLGLRGSYDNTRLVRVFAVNLGDTAWAYSIACSKGRTDGQRITIRIFMDSLAIQAD